ncbi:hypothetical protein DVH24_032735, partial [Malus domestica]
VPKVVAEGEQLLGSACISCLCRRPLALRGCLVDHYSGCCAVGIAMVPYGGKGAILALVNLEERRHGAMSRSLSVGLCPST